MTEFENNGGQGDRRTDISYALFCRGAKKSKIYHTPVYTPKI